MFSLKNLVRDSLVSKNTVYNFFIEFGSRYPTPDSLTYSWNFGFLALFCLVFQIVTGVILSSHYIPDANYAFESVEMIMRETNYGYYIRYMHANGASFFFLVVYIHMSKALFQCSYMYPRQSL